jgi:hypothetical protein
MGLFLLIVFIFDIHNCRCKNGRERRGGRRRMWFELTIWAFYSWIIILFHAVLFCYCFFCLSLFNAGWLISHQFQVNCWTIIPFQYFSYSPNLVITFLPGNIVWESFVAVRLPHIQIRMRELTCVNSYLPSLVLTTQIRKRELACVNSYLPSLVLTTLFPPGANSYVGQAYLAIGYR